jgi:hypothetical protein
MLSRFEEIIDPQLRPQPILQIIMTPFCRTDSQLIIFESLVRPRTSDNNSHLAEE